MLLSPISAAVHHLHYLALREVLLLTPMWCIEETSGNMDQAADPGMSQIRKGGFCLAPPGRGYSRAAGMPTCARSRAG